MNRGRGTLNSLFVAIHEDHGDHFHQSDYDETDGAGETVEHLQPILSSASTEDEPHEKAYDADNSCANRNAIKTAIFLINCFLTIYRL